MTGQKDGEHSTTFYKRRQIIPADTVDELAEFLADDYPYRCSSDWDINRDIDSFEEAKQELKQYLNERTESSMADLICEAIQPHGLIKTGGGMRETKYTALYR